MGTQSKNASCWGCYGAVTLAASLHTAACTFDQATVLDKSISLFTFHIVYIFLFILTSKHKEPVTISW